MTLRRRSSVCRRAVLRRQWRRYTSNDTISPFLLRCILTPTLAYRTCRRTGQWQQLRDITLSPGTTKVRLLASHRLRTLTLHLSSGSINSINSSNISAKLPTASSSIIKLTRNSIIRAPTRHSTLSSSLPSPTLNPHPSSKGIPTRNAHRNNPIPAHPHSSSSSSQGQIFKVLRLKDRNFISLTEYQS